MFKRAEIETPLGTMYAFFKGGFLHYLGFEEEWISATPGEAPLLSQELDLYFKGGLREFKTPLRMTGTPFQIQVWNALRNIPFGETCSYKEVASMIQNPKACRAVGLANGSNPFAIIVPCHRVIQADGSLGGYSSGLERKKWLLNHEKK
jgi:O-6-methylguanine DNA methyltransferase